MHVPRSLFVTLLLILCLAGCGGSTPKNETPPPGPKALSADQLVLRKLDCYDPMYKIDADGRVTRLRLPGRFLSVEVMAEIGKLTDLERLDLYGTYITDEGLAQLKNLQKLHAFGLGATPITEKSLAHLAKLESLQHVWLPKRAVSAAALEKLKGERPDLKVHPQ